MYKWGKSWFFVIMDNKKNDYPTTMNKKQKEGAEW